MLLDADQRAFFAEHGWLVVRGAVARERVAELERAVDEIYLAHARRRSGYVWEVAGSRRSLMLT